VHDMQKKTQPQDERASRLFVQPICLHWSEKVIRWCTVSGLSCLIDRLPSSSFSRQIEHVNWISGRFFASVAMHPLQATRCPQL
jgi:hypothetical protein